MTRLHGTLACAALLLGACSSVELAPTTTMVRRGPAFGQPSHRVVTLPATCGALDVLQQTAELHAPDRCTSGDLGSIDGKVRSLLDFAGADVIASDTLNAQTRSRREIETRTTTGIGSPDPLAPVTETTSRETVIEGSTFADAPLPLQREILREIRADAVLTTRIKVGAITGPSGRRLVQVQLRMAAALTGQLIWARRCSMEIGGLLATDLDTAEAGEFAGYALVQPDQLKLDTRGRTEEIVTMEAQSSSHGSTSYEKTLSRDSTSTSDGSQQSSSRTTTTKLDGSIFEDLSVADRQEVIRQSGADAVATVRVVIGGLQMSWTSGNHNVEVMVKLGVNQGDTMAWASRCIATSEQFTTIEAALEAASRCAMTVLD